MDVYSISQSAEDEHIGAKCFQFSDKRTDNILPIGGAVSCTDNIDNVSTVEVSIPEIIKKNRCIYALFEPLWIAFIIHRDRLNMMQLVVF